MLHKLKVPFLRANESFISSLPADTICQKPLFTHLWMSARTIKLFVVLAQEKRVPYDIRDTRFIPLRER